MLGAWLSGHSATPWFMDVNVSSIHHLNYPHWTSHYPHQVCFKIVHCSWKVFTLSNHLLMVLKTTLGNKTVFPNQSEGVRDDLFGRDCKCLSWSVLNKVRKSEGFKLNSCIFCPIFDNWYVQIKLRLDMCSSSALDLSPVWSVLTQPRQGNICLFGRNFMSTFYPPEPRF